MAINLELGAALLQGYPVLALPAPTQCFAMLALWAPVLELNPGIYRTPRNDQSSLSLAPLFQRKEIQKSSRLRWREKAWQALSLLSVTVHQENEQM
jgi:hypothetical protein